MKKFIKGFLICLLTVYMVCGLFSKNMQADNLKEGDFLYRILTSGTVEITGYTGSDTEIVIPDTIGGYMVTSIGNQAFKDCTLLRKIQLPSGLNKIGFLAFEGTNITNLTIPKATTGYCSGSGSLEGMRNLTSVTFENGTTKIPDYALSRSNVKEVYLPNTVTSIGEKAFYQCENIESIILPSSTIKIGKYAFSNCKSLRTINIPDAVTSIGNNVFSNCKGLKTISIPDAVTSIGNNAFSDCNNLENVQISDNSKITYIGSEVFENCELLKEIHLPSELKEIGFFAFKGTNITRLTIPQATTIYCSGSGSFEGMENLTSVIFENGTTKIPDYALSRSCVKEVFIPDTVNSIGKNAFLNCSDLNDIYYGGSKEQWTEISIGVNNTEIKNATMHFNGCLGVDEYINRHVDFVESAEYKRLLNLSEIALRDYGELKNAYDMWKVVRFDIFDNPYDVVLADLIISESSANGQIKAFSEELYSNQRTIVNSIMRLIDGQVEVSVDDKNKIKKFLTEKDFSDDATYALCKDIFTKVDEDSLKTIFQLYDIGDKFYDLYGDGQNIVDSVIDIINYCSILKAYEDTTEEFKAVLLQVVYYCQIESPGLSDTIIKYLKTNEEYSIRDEIIKKVVGNTIEVGVDIFSDTIVKKTSKFLLENMDFSKLTTADALKISKINSVVAGIQIGYDIGTSIDNILFESDKTADSYVVAYAAVKVGTYLELALDDHVYNLLNGKTLENAKIFCQAFGMYKNSQIIVADKMIQYLSNNNQSFISQITDDTKYEAEMYRWLIRKAECKKVDCHDDNSEIVKILKSMTVACPVDICVFDKNSKLVLSIVDNEINHNSGDITASVRNNIKYILMPDGEYSVEIKATDSGMMMYCISSYDTNGNIKKTVNYEGIILNPNQNFSGNIHKGDELIETAYALVSDDKIVDSDSGVFDENEKISIADIVFDKNHIDMSAGEIHSITYNILPQNASIKTVTWYSENPDVAKVDEYGNVFAENVGNTYIVCESLDGKIIRKCNVIVDSDIDPIKLPFSDVFITDWFYDAVAYVNGQGFMTGKTLTAFAPNESLARGQFSSILHRMNAEPAVEFESVFSDVEEGIWYTSPILWAKSVGIVNGYVDGRFGPGDMITREQLAIMMYNYARYQGFDISERGELDKFKDADSVSWYAEDAMQWAVGSGIISGKDNGTVLDPQGETVRAQCAAIIQKFVINYTFL